LPKSAQRESDPRLCGNSGFMAGLDLAISYRNAPCRPERDHRVTALRAGPVMTPNSPDAIP
jgi:hypothetical protein